LWYYIYKYNIFQGTEFGKIYENLRESSEISKKFSLVLNHPLNQDNKMQFNLLVPELFFLILAHPVYKQSIIQEPNKLEL